MVDVEVSVLEIELKHTDCTAVLSVHKYICRYILCSGGGGGGGINKASETFSKSFSVVKIVRSETKISVD